MATFIVLPHWETYQDQDQVTSIHFKVICRRRLDGALEVQILNDSVILSDQMDEMRMVGVNVVWVCEVSLGVGCECECRCGCGCGM